MDIYDSIDIKEEAFPTIKAEPLTQNDQNSLLDEHQSTNSKDSDCVTPDSNDPFKEDPGFETLTPLPQARKEIAIKEENEMCMFVQVGLEDGSSSQSLDSFLPELKPDCSSFPVKGELPLLPFQEFQQGSDANDNEFQKIQAHGQILKGQGSSQCHQNSDELQPLVQVQIMRNKLKQSFKCELTQNVSFKEHPPDGIFTCTFCNKDFKEKLSFKKHLLTHMDKKTLKWGQSFASKIKVNDHLSFHSCDKPYNCSKCLKNFTLKLSLKRHKCSNSKLGNEPYTCTRCNRSFTLETGLNRHLRAHSKSGDNSFTCSECGKTFTQKSSMKRHLLSRHSNEKPFGCSICGKCFTSKSYLQTHFLIHSSDKPFKCDHCSKTFAEKSRLNRHLLTHFVEKYVCKHCNTNFTHKSMLNVHLKIHSGDPEACPRI